jgi:hypothetical protein
MFEQGLVSESRSYEARPSPKTDRDAGADTGKWLSIWDAPLATTIELVKIRTRQFANGR